MQGVQGSLCRGGLCPGGVSVQEGSLSRRVSVQEGLCPGGSLGGLCAGGLFRIYSWRTSILVKMIFCSGQRISERRATLQCRSLNNRASTSTLLRNH